MARIDQDWVHLAKTQAVFDSLEAGGFSGWFVGGCVRDALMGRPVYDVDISTDALPDDTISLTERAGLRAVPTGKDHGTITVIADETPYEVTTLRRDVATDGRRAVVAFASGIDQDAHRRDFTMNALYADRTGVVLDPLGIGLGDLNDGRIRFIDDPRARIREDYLRILRFFRFHATHGNPELGLDPGALAAIADLSDGLDTLSRERVGHEVLRLLAAPDPAPSVAAMAAAGVLSRVLPGADHRLLAPLVHIEQSAGLPPDDVRRLATLGGEDVPNGLRLSKKQAKRLAILRNAMTGPAPAVELGYRYGADVAVEALALRAAVTGDLLTPEAMDQAKRGASQRFPVTASDLQSGLDGPALGRRLADLERRWIASDFKLDKPSLLSSD